MEEPGKDNFSDLFDSGVDYLKNKDYSAALDKFTQAIDDRNPRLNKVFNLIGTAYFEQGRYEEAITNHKKSIEVKEDNAKAHYNLGVDYFHVADYDSAIRSFNRAIEIAPKDVDSYNFLGSTYYYKRDYVEAIKFYEKVTQIDPKPFHAFRNWGLALRELHQAEEAVLKFKKAISIKDDFMLAYFDLGYSLEILGYYDESLENYKKVIESSDTPVQKAFAQHNIGNIYWKIGDVPLCRAEYQKACVLYQQLIDEGSQNVECYIYYGSILKDVFGDLERSEQVFTLALEIDPNNVKILIGLGNLYEAKDNDWMSLTKFRQAATILSRITATDEEVVSNLAYTKAKLLDYAEAEALLLQQKKKKDSGSINLHLAFLYGEQDQHEKVFEHLKKAFRYEPCNINLRYRLAEVSLKLKRLEAAEQELKKIELVSPHHVSNLVSLANLYLMLAESDDEDHYQTAERYLTKAINLISRDYTIGYVKNSDLSNIYYKRGFARIKIQSSKNDGRFLLLKASNDFKKSVKLDPLNNASHRALAKLRSIRPLLKKNFIEKIGQVLIIMMSLFVFVFTQVLFGIRKQYWLYDDYYLELPTLEPHHYGLFTFGSLILLIAGLYLPQIIKLKVAGIELEKNSIEQAPHITMKSITLESPNLGVKT